MLNVTRSGLDGSGMSYVVILEYHGAEALVRGWGAVGAWCAAEPRYGVGFGVSGRVDRGWMAGSS